ncbi:MAG TPA: MMPL family transporter, partial [Thermoleophilaceae bacterium]|nr:MMPL family transporter [Thermoleophilaceae bacterium]
MSTRFASAVVRLRWVVLAFWIAAAAVVVTQLPTIREAQVGALGDLVPRNSDAVDAELRSSELFRFPLLSRTIVVQRDADGLGVAEEARIAARALAINRGQDRPLRRVAGALPLTNAVGHSDLARERSTTAITYLFFQPEVGREDRQILAERLVERRIEPRFDGFAGVTGAIAARSQQSELISESLPLVELATVLLVALVVALHFRALGAPLVTLTAVGISYVVSIRLIAWIGQKLGISVPSEVEPVIVVLLFGVVTDYSIFFLSRVRSRIADGEDARTATVRGTAELLPIIVTAGLTVVAASASLVAAKLGFLEAFGPGVALAVLIGLLVAITLIPALLAIGGSAVFWPRRPGVEVSSAEAAEEKPGAADRRPRRSRALEIATRRPRLVALACGAFLLVAASGLTTIDLGNPLIRGLPADADAREGYRQASQGFAPGILSPTVVIVEGDGVAGRRRALSRFQALLAQRRGVAEVVGPADQPAERAFGAVLSETGDAARFFVVLGTDPLGGRAVQRLRALRARLPSLLREAGLNGATVSVAGDTALVTETIDKTVDDLARVAPVAIAVLLIILAGFLRALVAPLYLVGASVLALAASLGLTGYVFQVLLGHGEITYFVPFAAAVLLVSLGSDYNVFLVGRIWDEARERPLREAVRVAGARAATPITIAGLVLAGSFALLALVPIRPFQELAFAMAA